MFSNPFGQSGGNPLMLPYESDAVQDEVHRDLAQRHHTGDVDRRSIAILWPLAFAAFLAVLTLPGTLRDPLFALSFVATSGVITAWMAFRRPGLVGAARIAAWLCIAAVVCVCGLLVLAAAA